MQINPSEISELIKSKIQNLQIAAEKRNEGTVISVTDGICRIHGLADVRYGEMIEFPGNVFGLALNLEQDSVGAVVLGVALAFAVHLINESALGEFSAAVRAVNADITTLRWPESLYDGVAAIFIQFADPAQRERIFHGMVRCLKPGGILVLQGYTPRQLEYRTGGPGIESHLYTPQLLRAPDSFGPALVGLLRPRVLLPDCVIGGGSDADTLLINQGGTLLPRPAAITAIRAVVWTFDGVQLIARDSGSGGAIGFATVYWSFSTTQAARVGVMNPVCACSAASTLPSRLIEMVCGPRPVVTRPAKTRSGGICSERWSITWVPSAAEMLSMSLRPPSPRKRLTAS